MPSTGGESARPGSAREEAERLVAAVLGAASVGARSLGARGPMATGSAECCVCPVCRVIAAMREPDPEFAERVATGAGDLAAAVAGLLRSFTGPVRRDPAGAGDPGAGADDDEPWRAATRDEPPPAPPPPGTAAPPRKLMAKKAVKKAAGPPPADDDPDTDTGTDAGDGPESS